MSEGRRNSLSLFWPTMLPTSSGRVINTIPWGKAETVGMGITWVAHQGDAFEDSDGTDDECKVRGDAERVVEGDLGQVRRQLLKVDILSAAAFQRLIEHLP